MRHVPRVSKKRIVILLVMAFLLSSGCSVLRTAWKSTSSYDAKDADRSRSLGDDGVGSELARQFGLMAVLADRVYRRDLAIGSPSYESACARADSQDLPPKSASGQWLRWQPDSDVEACVNERGLFMETFVYRTAAGIEKAAIVYRGTENGGMQIYYDWISNISAALGFQPPQYALAREKTLKIVSALCGGVLKDCGDRVEIVTAGHSLGGGLAQQAGYLSKEISQVYTFNTTPVTNWTSLRHDRVIMKEYPTIYRIFHVGEILTKLRFVTTTFTKTRFGRYDIGVQFQQKSDFGGHSMTVLACGFSRLIKDTASAGAFDYTPQAAAAIYDDMACASVLDLTGVSG